MKILALAVLYCLSFVSPSDCLYAQAITVASAGTINCNGVYFENGSFNGRPYYHKQDVSAVIRYDSIKGWIISTSGASDFFYVKNNTAGIPGDYPPDGGWSIQSGAIGSAPAPTSVYDASLPVELHSFSVELFEDLVRIAWVTESETDNVGFVLERTVETLHATLLQWDVIATYETNANLQGQGNSSEQHEYVFNDMNTAAGHSYLYRLSDVNTAGEVHVYDEIAITLPDVLLETVLEPPFPNPFNPQTKINYQLAESGPVEIIVYDLLGRKVRTLVNEEQSTGSYNVYWHGNDMSGRKIATGTYIIVMKSEQGVKTQKAVMIR
ncbi:T9SS type A sorting domain-containing protein [bacterium]|nr:T9SS type A sorting domain-containing protein [bacterium]